MQVSVHKKKNQYHARIKEGKNSKCKKGKRRRKRTMQKQKENAKGQKKSQVELGCLHTSSIPH